MKYLKKFLEINEYKWIVLSKEEQSFIDDIKDIIIEAEDIGYTTSYWLNGYRQDRNIDEPILKLEIEFNKDKKVSKEDFEQIIQIIERLEGYLSQTDFKMINITLFDFTKPSTQVEEYKTNIIPINEIYPELDNINTYFIIINRK